MTVVHMWKFPMCNDITLSIVLIFEYFHKLSSKPFLLFFANGYSTNPLFGNFVFDFLENYDFTIAKVVHSFQSILLILPHTIYVPGYILFATFNRIFFYKNLMSLRKCGIHMCFCYSKIREFYAPELRFLFQKYFYFFDRESIIWNFLYFFDWLWSFSVKSTKSEPGEI